MTCNRFSTLASTLWPRRMPPQATPSKCISPLVSQCMLIYSPRNKMQLSSSNSTTIIPNSNLCASNQASHRSLHHSHRLWPRQERPPPTPRPMASTRMITTKLLPKWTTSSNLQVRKTIWTRYSSLNRQFCLIKISWSSARFSSNSTTFNSSSSSSSKWLTTTITNSSIQLRRTTLRCYSILAFKKEQCRLIESEWEIKFTILCYDTKFKI